jgi:hypothetical protein
MSHATLTDWTQPGAGDQLDAEFLMPAQPKRKVPVKVDLVFAVDRTGSSQTFAQGIRTAIPMIANQLLGKAARVRLFLQTHGDLDCNQHPAMLVRDGQIEDIVTAINAVRFEGGGDEEEHHSHGVETVVESVDWSGLPPTSRGAIVLFTTADTKPSPSGRSLEQIGQSLRERGIMLFAVCELKPGIQAMAEAAHGLIFPISNNPSPAEMAQITAKVGASVTDSVIDGLSQA